jgi:hypothetical protein
VHWLKYLEAKELEGYSLVRCRSYYFHLSSSKFLRRAVGLRVFRVFYWLATYPFVRKLNTDAADASEWSLPIGYQPERHSGGHSGVVQPGLHLRLA